NDLDSADRMLDQMVIRIDTMLIDLRGMPPYRGDSAFRDAAINSFGFYKRAFGDDYKQLISIQKNKSDTGAEANAEMQRIVDHISREEEKLDKTFHNAQQSFAEKNHM